LNEVPIAETIDATRMPEFVVLARDRREPFPHVPGERPSSGMSVRSNRATRSNKQNTATLRAP
jgi:hypothetical protein